MEIVDKLTHREISSRNKGMRTRLILLVKYYLLPVLAASYPSLYFYGTNVHDLLLINLGRVLAFYVFIATVTYLAMITLYRGNPLKAANATFVFLVLFNLYGLIENLLIKLDWFTVHAFITVPLTLLLAGYLIWLINRLNENTANIIWNYFTLVMGGLIIYNFALILPVEVSRLQKPKLLLSEKAGSTEIIQQADPDIYYIIFDEFSGFGPMRDYWKNPRVDDFSDFLSESGFVIFEDPHSNSTNTLYELATRLNYMEYPDTDGADTQDFLFEVRANNRAMEYLKQKGYTTVTFDEIQSAYPSAAQINSDVTYNYVDMPATTLGVLFDDFGILVAENTILKVLSPYYKRLGTNQHSNFIFFTANNIGELDEISSPKFVFVHLILPHSPFMFDESGNMNHPHTYTDYNYYLRNYNFSLYLGEKMVSNILSSADPANPPVIVLQSDHGLRNFSQGFSGQFENYPEEYKTSILYALLLPGYEPSYSTQEMDPINTFPIIFNHLFDANIPLQ